LGGFLRYNRKNQGLTAAAALGSIPPERLRRPYNPFRKPFEKRRCRYKELAENKAQAYL